MVAAKGRLNRLTDRVTQDWKMTNSGQVQNFKVYAEVDKVKLCDTLNNDTKGESIPLNSGGCLLSVNDSKSGTKNLEKSKSKPDKSVKLNVGRKVLADISNVKSSFSKTEQGKSSRPGHRDAVDLGNAKSSLADKPSRGSLRLDMIHDAEQNRTLKKPALNKNIKAISDEPRTKFQGRNSATTTATGRKLDRTSLHQTRKSLPVLKQVSRVETSGRAKENSGKSDKFRGKHGFPGAATATGRKSDRNSLHLTRKSLPVLKQVSRVETSGTVKENSWKSDKLRGKHGFPVKPSVRRSIVPKPSNLSSRRWGNRVSDGFAAMASRAQTKVDAGVSSRKSVKPSVRTSTSLNTQRNSKQDQIFARRKLRSGPADLSKRKQDNSCLSKDIPSVVPHEESAPEEDISGGTSNICKTTSDIVERRKSDRRNSFTCLLISRSKLLKECSKVTSQETLPNIYDDRNHLEVSDYVDDIYQYYWVMEGQNPLLKNYMEIQSDITPQMRGILINWLIEVHLKFDLMEETLFLTVTLLDRYLSLESIKKNDMQLVGLTALLLASKYEDFWHPRVTDLISISAESYTRDQMLKMEKTILKRLKFRLNEPTLYVFMLRFLKAAQSELKFERLAFYLIELCLVEYEALNYKPSMLCASAIYVARCTMQMTPPWTPLLAKHARCEESQIRGCAEMILKFHKAAKTSLLKVIYEKYTKQDYSRVATIKPLDRLPA